MNDAASDRPGLDLAIARQMYIRAQKEKMANDHATVIDVLKHWQDEKKLMDAGFMSLLRDAQDRSVDL